jgi:hypothetical protein
LPDAKAQADNRAAESVRHQRLAAEAQKACAVAERTAHGLAEQLQEAQQVLYYPPFLCTHEHILSPHFAAMKAAYPLPFSFYPISTSREIYHHHISHTYVRKNKNTNSY